MPLETSSERALARPLTTIVLGLLLFLQGLGKLLDPRDYLHALARFHVMADYAVPTVGAAWTALEVVCGFSIVVAALIPRRNWAVPGLLGALVIGVAYCALVISGMAHHLDVANCTVFGRFYPEPLHWPIILQEVLFTLWVGWELVRLRWWPS